MSNMREIRGIVGNVLLGWAMKAYADDDPVKLELALWITGRFSHLHNVSPEQLRKR